jgi:hypothetical protein
VLWLYYRERYIPVGTYCRKKIQFGIPITITKVGTSAVRLLFQNEINQKSKSITPITTIKIEINVALKERKKKKNIKEVINKETPIKG